MSDFSHPKPGMHVERFCANDADSDPHMSGACDAMEVCVKLSRKHSMPLWLPLVHRSGVHTCMLACGSCMSMSWPKAVF